MNKIQNVFSSTSTVNADEVPCDCNQSFLIDSAVTIFVTRLRGARFSLIVCFFYLTPETAAWKFSVNFYFPKKKNRFNFKKGDSEISPEVNRKISFP